VAAFVSAGAGFLLAVLWFDLMFDVQVIGRGGAVLPEAVLASIAAYYARVTTAARPMNRLVAAVMLATLAALVVQLARGDSPSWPAWVALPLVLVAVGLAAGHTVPAAVRLGGRGDPAQTQTLLARAILRDHLICLAAIAAVIVIELAFAT
jgi:hypothetical protein